LKLQILTSQLKCSASGGYNKLESVYSQKIKIVPQPRTFNFTWPSCHLAFEFGVKIQMEESEVLTEYRIGKEI
jgi:hypothetical protein